ncbi:uncharacterized protein LOC114298138 [Camellia sinensis]|uniref:uncharacterized protein LOC114298138 n=1 Tax=Camellia sinensis TaxID=4442 RepID=UPI00103596F7|nr:uncharacterized protein LOC114259206 isoform X4 [Camellia sinensis]XP_028098443.1 uncharacterized protein LOC114298138 [Camellia sinensis]
MEAAAGVAAVRGVSMPMPTSQPSRKEWRVVSEHSVRNSSSEDLDRSKLGQSDERTIYEVQQGREPADVDFCSITIDGSLDNDILQQRLHGVARQREGLQQIEIELRAQIIARSEIIEIQNNFDAQITEHANANVKLQEQLHEMEQTIHELERKTEEKDRELHAIKLDNEAAWAKDDLLREQNKELQTFRRERDNSEAERAQHLKQMHDLQEHIQDKERQFLELQEQHRVAQETILFKDEQLRDAQAWITRAQEMDALHSTTNHSLQAELRERTEQYNQLWLGCQRQFAEMERLHLHTIQQLQLELADARERSGTYTEESRVSQTNSNDALQYGQNNGNQLDVDGGVTTNSNSGDLPNGNVENVTSFVSTGNASTQVTALHPFVMHQQGVPHSVPAHVTQSHVGHFHSVPAISSLQHWQNQQAASEGLQVPTHNQYPSSQTDQSLLRPDTNYDYEVSVNGQAIHPDYLDVHASQGMEPDTVITASVPEGQVLEQVDKSYLVAPQPQQSLQHISSQFREALRIDSLSQDSETKEKIITSSTNHGLEVQEFITEQASSANTQSSETPITHVNFSETTMNNATGVVSSESFVSSGEKNVHPGGKTSETALLDERSLLACIVRTIPPGSGGRIRISSTLPNRLSKMLAPLHWHDYKKKYGKLDDFVAGHPELFLIEEDYIQLREGAQEIIAATAAVAKVAAAAKTASSPYSSLLPSVAVTPMAQSHRLKRAPSIDSSRPASATDNHSQLSVQNQHSNGVHLNAGGISNIKILSKPKDPLELNGAESRPGQSSGLVAVGNGANPDRSGLGNSLSKGRSSANFVGKLQGRATGVASTSRR